MFHEYVQTHAIGELLLPPSLYRPYPKRQERARWEALGADQKHELTQWGNEALQGYPMLYATQFMAFTRTKSRAVFEEPYFTRRKRLWGAALAECVTDDGRYLDAIIDGIWCICEETTWVLSAHNGSDHPGQRPQTERLLPDKRNPFLDLFAAQTAAGLADILYLLEDKLDAVSPLIARRVRQEIAERVLQPFMTHDDFWWMGMIRRDVNNWTPWILSNVLECLLILERDESYRTEGVRRCMRMLDSYLAVLPEDGGCDEGAAYFNMAGASLFDCLESLYKASGGRICFYDEPFIARICAYPAHACIGDGWFVNFADCDAKPHLDGQRLLRIGESMNLPEVARLGREMLRRYPRLCPADTPQLSRVLQKLFCADDAGEASDAPATEKQVVLPCLQLYAWRHQGLYAAIKGGHNAESHNHNDIGSFIVYADNMPQIMDLGNRIYTAVTFGPDRYTLPNTRSVNHNVPLIGSFEQVQGAAHRAEDVIADDNGVRMDIAAAYPDEAGVEELLRTFEKTADGFLLRDAVRLSEESPVTFTLMLAEAPVLCPGHAALSRIGIDFDPSLRADVTHLPPDDERFARNFPLGAWRLALTSEAAAVHQTAIRIKRRDLHA